MSALLVATRNEHKLRELRESLAAIDLDPLPADIDLPPEEAETFTENALGKARAAHAATGRAAIADDSGIEAYGLGGRPGVRSARYAGEGASDEQNVDKLLAEVGGQSDRRVAYVCVIALVTEDGREEAFEGRCEGTLAREPRGSGGFGYDPLFYYPALGATFAQISPEAKHAVSHRGRAMAEARRILLEWAGGRPGRPGAHS
jgi:XTP/dITP diphosphohydrolase